MANNHGKTDSSSIPPDDDEVYRRAMLIWESLTPEEKIEYLFETKVIPSDLYNRFAHEKTELWELPEGSESNSKC